MSSGTLSHDVKAYLDAVRTRLDDLPAEERDDLLADVEPSLLDSAGESDVPVERRLGPPDSFADELRAAAGLPPRGGQRPTRPRSDHGCATGSRRRTTSSRRARAPPGCATWLRSGGCSAASW